ncbi:sensor histidine kinase [Streptacidiphilus fuscans]|uniref:histidine kinase n=1 Tax=Streptacidiphilus fuscans TaxID=2789292 RepID=A0A931B9R8_9ACTN|nr:histidine kinase [Streptacidiphilus fuscans]MBF9072778.1 sensor histidine kinase [Streptacidiphilus fuscans]
MTAPALHRRWPPRRVDAVVVAVAAVLGVANSWVKPSNGLLTGQSIALVASFSGAVALVLWWRRRAPRVVACVLLVAHMVAFTPTALAVAMYTVGDECRRSARTLWAFGVAGCAADLVAVQGGGPQWNLREAAYSLAAVVGPLVVGYAVALRRDLAAAARSELVVVERWHALLVEQARETERRRIAREMHDVVSHRVGHMVLTAGSLEVARDPDPEQVAEKAGLIRTEGRHALEELREILGVLAPDRSRESRDPHHRAPLTPQPDASALPGLADRTRQTGHDVALHVSGHPEGLPTVVQQAVYRAVQEALTNAAKHAPGAPISVTVNSGADAVQVTVVNGPPTRAPEHGLPSGGNGLLGLRERAALLGGSVEAGPYQGGFRLSLQLPARPGHADPTGPSA